MNARASRIAGASSAALLFALALSATAHAETQPNDIFIGTLSVDGGEVILKRCDIASNTYVLRDDPEADGDAVAGFKASGKPAYGEVIGRYVEEADGRNGLIVPKIENVTPGRDCHLLSALNALDQGADGPALWLGPEGFTGADIVSLSMDFSFDGMPVLNVVLAPTATERLAIMTQQQAGKELEFKLADRLIQRVVLTEPITEGRLQLSGRYSVVEIKQMMRDMYCTLGLSKTAVPGLSRKERRCPSK